MHFHTCVGQAARTHTHGHMVQAWFAGGAGKRQFMVYADWHARMRHVTI